MIIKVNKNVAREKRRIRVRSKVSGTAVRPRMNVYRSTGHIYVQIIDDALGKTLVSCSTIAKGIDVKGKTKSQAAEVVGQEVAKRAIALGITEVVFDRAGYLYTGRVKALADGARNGGLKF